MSRKCVKRPLYIKALQREQSKNGLKIVNNEIHDFKGRIIAKIYNIAGIRFFYVEKRLLKGV